MMVACLAQPAPSSLLLLCPIPRQSESYQLPPCRHLLGAGCSEWAERYGHEEPGCQLRLPEFQSWTEAASKNHPICPQASAAMAQNSTVASEQGLSVLPRDPEPASVSRKPHRATSTARVEMI